MKGEDLVTDELVNIAEDSARGSFFLVSGTALSTVVMAISTILVGRLIGSELYGKYTLALVIPSLLLLFADLGINQGIVKFTAGLRLKGETHRVAKIVKHGLLIKAIAGVLLFLINYTLADLLASVLLQRPDMAFYVRVISTSILFQVIFSTASFAFVGLDKTEYNALAANVQAFAKATISISLVLLGFGVLGALSGYVSSYVIASIAATAILFLLRALRSHTSNSKMEPTSRRQRRLNNRRQRHLHSIKTLRRDLPINPQRNCSNSVLQEYVRNRRNT
jgi:O-antigen/teichoic acid export membrane protein